jgi:predicted RNA-binding Zn-ribbon protein involved in translation (DUF1610 family)
MRSDYGATLMCSSCGRRFKEATSPSGFKCPRCVDDYQRRKASAIEKKVVVRDSIRVWRKP